MQAAVALAEAGSLVTFGVMPDSRHDGFVYFNAGEPIGEGFKAVSSREKPDEETANQALNIGGSYCNSEIFLFSGGHYLHEFQRLRSHNFDACAKSMKTVKTELDLLRVDATMLSECSSESVDCAFMDNREDAAMVPLNATWSHVKLVLCLGDKRQG